MSVEYHMQGILIDILCEDHEYCMNIGEYCPKQYYYMYIVINILCLKHFLYKYCVFYYI